MQKFTFDRRTTGLFTDQQNLFSYDQERLLPFLNRAFSIENIANQVYDKSVSFSVEKRKSLVSELRKQYASLPVSTKVNEHIDALESKHTFTVTTGHQLSLFTGPVFFIYKILHVIRLCEELNHLFKEYQFVPVFWMASEDHDLEEVRSVDIFGRTLSWETDQEGAVGRMNTEGLEELKSTIRSFYEGKEEADVDRILASYSGNTLAEAQIRLVHSLFGFYGLICLDGDNREFKKSFVPCMERELTDSFSFHNVLSATEDLEKEGFKAQLKSREINLFYLSQNDRSRILKERDGFYLKGHGILSLDETLELLRKHPESFSPNVVLRPLYQESILPNVCYVGGVSELSYWMQLKGVFEEVRIPYPLVQVRTSILYLDATTDKKLKKANLKLEDLFLDREALKRVKLKEQAGDELDLSAIDDLVQLLKQELASKINSFDIGLKKYAEAETVKLDKQIDSIREKLTRILKQRHEAQMNTIDQLYSKLFPDSVMQERVLNIFGMCPDGKIQDRIAQLHLLIDPLEPDLVVLSDRNI
jgi:bacillithiol biosynthesis cysteine-adding enzyme BshC